MSVRGQPEPRISVLLALAFATPDAAAANVPKIRNIRIRDTDASGAGTYKIGVIATHDDDVADVVAEVDGVTYTLAFARSGGEDGQDCTARAGDEDPLTSVAIDRWQAYDATPQEALFIVSDGWYTDDPLPTYAEVTLAGGEQWIVPVNSYQVAGIARLAPAAEPRTACALDSDEHVVVGETLADGTVVLSVTAYGTNAAALPTSEALTFTCTNRRGVSTSERAAVAYDDEVAVVFGYTFELAEAPHGLELSGKVRLRGRQTLLVGRFAGQLGVDDDGDLGLAAIDRGALAPRGDILIGGEPIDFERQVGGENVRPTPPAVVLLNGKGTKNSTSTAGQTLEAELL